MSGRGNALSRNPNMCASCSSLLDGMDDSEKKGTAVRPSPNLPEQTEVRKKQPPALN